MDGGTVTREKIFPGVIVLMYIGACIFYTAVGDWKKAIYSMLAAGLNAVYYL